MSHYLACVASSTESSYTRSYHLSLQLTVKMRHLQASFTITVASSQKTDPFKYGAKIYIGAMDTSICSVEEVPSYTGRNINHPDLHPNFLSLAKQFLSMLQYLRSLQAEHILQDKNVNDIISLFC